MSLQDNNRSKRPWNYFWADDHNLDLPWLVFWASRRTYSNKWADKELTVFFGSALYGAIQCDCMRNHRHYLSPSIFVQQVKSIICLWLIQWFYRWRWKNRFSTDQASWSPDIIHYFSTSFPHSVHASHRQFWHDLGDKKLTCSDFLHDCSDDPLPVTGCHNIRLLLL